MKPTPGTCAQCGKAIVWVIRESTGERVAVEVGALDKGQRIWRVHRCSSDPGRVVISSLPKKGAAS